MQKILLSVLLVVSSAWLAAQGLSSQPAFKAGVELTQIDVSVLDGKRQPVRGLKASDFTVLEDGQPRPIQVFEAVDHPSAARAPGVSGSPSEPAMSAAVSTNHVGQEDGRLVFILMDRTIPPGQPTVAARKVATAAVEMLGPDDLAAVVTTSGGVPQSLTADRGRLIAALNRGDWSTGPSRAQEDVIGKDDPLSDGRCLCGLCVLETVTRIADAAQTAPRRRKILLFIGRSAIVQAGPRAASADVGCDSRVRDARRKLFDALALSNLTVHSIDPIGLVSVGPQTRASMGGAKGGPENQGPADRLKAQGDETNELLSNQAALGVLPEQTGGRTIVSTNAPEEKVPAIFRESDAYYVLGFEPGAGGQPDVKRSIEVNVARNGVQVNTTRYAVAHAAGDSEPGSPAVAAPVLERALTGLLPVASVPLEMVVAAFARPDSLDAYVSLCLNATSFTGTGATSLPFDIGVSALDQTGRHVASARQAAMVLLPDATPGATGGAAQQTTPVDLQTHLNLKPGDYELRAAVMDRTRGLVASVFSQVGIPAFGSDPLSLSDVVMGTRENPDAPPDAATPLIPVLATAQRVFHRGDPVRAFLQVYQGTQRTDTVQAVSVRTSIADEHGRVAYDQPRTLAPTDFVNRRAEHLVTIPLDGLTPGRYVLRIEASLGKQTASRTVRFVAE